MPIPDFNADGVLPPHADFLPGRDIRFEHLSPFPATSFEVCQKYGLISPVRREILRGWLEMRALLCQLGLDGFQWIDGSFFEDAENRRGRPPADLDAVSFLHYPSNFSLGAIASKMAHILSDAGRTKDYFKVHHMVVNLQWRGDVLVDNTRYWCGLFSHRRDDGVWKGMLKIDLSTPADDASGRQYLDSIGTP